MSAVLKWARAATLIAAVAAPVAASADVAHSRAPATTLHRLEAKIPADTLGAAVGAVPAGVLISPQGWGLGTDPDINVRFELGRDWIRGR